MNKSSLLLLGLLAPQLCGMQTPQQPTQSANRTQKDELMQFCAIIGGAAVIVLGLHLFDKHKNYKNSCDFVHNKQNNFSDIITAPDGQLINYVNFYAATNLNSPLYPLDAFVKHTAQTINQLDTINLKYPTNLPTQPTNLNNELLTLRTGLKHILSSVLNSQDYKEEQRKHQNQPVINITFPPHRSRLTVGLNIE